MTRIVDALGPRPMALVTAPALARSPFAADVSQESLDIAASLNVQLLIGAALDRLSLARVLGQSTAEGTFDLHAVAVVCHRNLAH